MSCKKATYEEVPKPRRLIGMSLDEDFPQVEWRTPSSALLPYVHGHWVSRWEFDPRMPTFERLHEPCVVMFHHRGRLTVSGIRRGRQVHRPHGGTLVGTRFRAGAFSAFSTMTSWELLERFVPAADAFGEEGSRLEGELLALGEDVDARVALIESFLAARAARIDARLDLITAVTTAMTDFEAATSVSRRAGDHGVSTRTLQRAFDDLVGVGPKWVMRRYRIRAATERLARGELEDTSTLALELGYFDQAHFIRDFKSQVGQSPHALHLRSRGATAGGVRDRPPT